VSAVVASVGVVAARISAAEETWPATLPACRGPQADRRSNAQVVAGSRSASYRRRERDRALGPAPNRIRASETLAVPVAVPRARETSETSQVGPAARAECAQAAGPLKVI
jgi:hypothetical protein